MSKVTQTQGPELPSSALQYPQEIQTLKHAPITHNKREETGSQGIPYKSL